MAGIPASEPHGTAEDPRRRLLLAGARLLLEDAVRVLQSGCSPELVATAAGRSRRTFYDHFPSKHEYVEALVDACTAMSVPMALDDQWRQHFAGVVAGMEGDLLGFLEQTTAEASRQWRESPEARLRLFGRLVASSDPDLSESDRRRSRRADATFQAAIHEAMGLWDLDLRPPWTAARFARLLSILLDGIAIQAEVDEHDDELLGLLMISLLPTLTRDLGDTGVVTDVVGDSLRALTEHWRDRLRPAVVANARERVLGALRETLAAHGVAGSTLDRIAAAAQVSRPTIARAFGEVRDLVIMAMEEYLPSLENEAALDIEAGSSTREATHRHLQRLHHLGTTDRPLVEAVLQLGLVGSDADRTRPGLFFGELCAPLQQILEAGAARGEIQAHLPLVRASRMLTVSALGRSVTDVVSTPAEAASEMCALVFDGLAG